MADTIEKPRTANFKGFCFRDALHDSLFHDADALKRRKQRLRKPDPRPKGREPWKDLSDEELRAQIYEKVESLSGQPLAALWAHLNGKPEDAESSPPHEHKPLIPTAPPGGQLYENRPSTSEKAPAFIQRVYGPWLDGSLTRADLRRLDPKAEAALRNWEQYNKIDAPFDLPTVEKRNDRLIDAARPLESSNNKEAARLRAAALRRARKIK